MLAELRNRFPDGRIPHGVRAAMGRRYHLSRNGVRGVRDDFKGAVES